ncbi:sensor histidine kinase [Sulfitobacter guttiformis]|uniref:sensor histidine kinase n=1 Tax=Sulfitobacter guttiformis TaxID=74349 RepID=UPI000A52C725|nr:HAMP domain-containing sensor histidine kinase [Sulfitobacter guttiformis]
MLVSALDQIAASIVIYDSDLLAIHWNAGFERAFPSLIPDFENGKSMPEMIAQSYRDGTIQSDMTDTEIDCFVDGLIEKMRDGTSPTRTVRLGAGQAFEARDFKVGANNYASIRVDVTRLQDQQDTIADQAKRLEIVNGQLQSFAFIAAHDLRAPLYQQQALMGFIVEDMAEARITVPPEVQANWTVIEALSGRMMVLIKDLLAFAQAEVKDQPKDLVSPSKRLEDIVALVNQKAGFEVVIAPDMPEVLVNATAFDTVMRNLISNGIKHHDKQKGRVTVRGQVDGAFVRISVEDDGVGIPSQHIGTIFEPFKRLSASGDGIGLGLAHIKKTVEAWGGSVSVTPLMPRGSVFAITIPNHRLTLISS